VRPPSTSLCRLRPRPNRCLFLAVRRNKLFLDQENQSFPEVLTSDVLDRPDRPKDCSLSSEARIWLLEELDDSLEFVASQHEMWSVVQFELMAQALLTSIFWQKRKGDFGAPDESGVRRRHRLRADTPPQMRIRSLCSSAQSRHSSRTGHSEQIATAPTPPSESAGNQRSGSPPKHSADCRHAAAFGSDR
jgi:hypothetical protein